MKLLAIAIRFSLSQSQVSRICARMLGEVKKVYPKVPEILRRLYLTPYRGVCTNRFGRTQAQRELVEYVEFNTPDGKFAIPVGY